MYGTSKQFPVLRERTPLDHSSSEAFQSSVRNDRDFSTVFTQDGPNSSSSLLIATADSYPSFEISTFLNIPQSPSRSPCPEPQWPDSQQAARSPSSTTLSSTSPSSSTDSHPVHCGQCQTTLNDVEPTLKHTSAEHRSPGSSLWPCVLSNCRKCFENKKDLERHLGDQHFDKRYTCSCGPRRRRRDKHKVHIKHCPPVGDGLYTCQCGHTIGGQEPRALERHQHHIEKECRECQPRRRGRPPKSDKKSAQRRTDGGNLLGVSYGTSGSGIQ